MIWLTLIFIGILSLILYRLMSDVEKLERWCGHLEAELENLRSQLP